MTILNTELPGVGCWLTKGSDCWSVCDWVIDAHSSMIIILKTFLAIGTGLIVLALL